MSLWGIFQMPQMFAVSYILFISSQNKDSSVKSVRLKAIYRIGPHPLDVLSIIFGSLLGDGHAEKRLYGNGTRIAFYQEHSHVSYMIYLHSLLSSFGYCNLKSPSIGTRLGIGGKVRKTVRFTTWTYTSFNWIHEIWYVNGVKVVPDCISYYLTPLALAIWIMDDGSKVGKSLKFSTNSFTYGDCLKLITVLNNNFGLKCTIQSAGAADQYIIYVRKESMHTLRNIVYPYIIPEMRYKII